MNVDFTALAKSFREDKEAIEAKLKLMQKQLDGLAYEQRRLHQEGVQRRLMGEWKLPIIAQNLKSEGEARNAELLNTPSVMLLPDTEKLMPYQKTLVRRTYHYALCNQHLPTIGHVVARTEAEFLKYRNCGKRCLEFLKLCLHVNDLSLSMHIDPTLVDPKWDMSIKDLLKGLPEKRIEEIEAYLGGFIPKMPTSVDIDRVGDFILRNESQVRHVLQEKEFNIVKKRLDKLGISLMARTF